MTVALVTSLLGWHAMGLAVPALLRGEGRLHAVFSFSRFVWRMRLAPARP